MQPRREPDDETGLMCRTSRREFAALSSELNKTASMTRTDATLIEGVDMKARWFLLVAPAAFAAATALAQSHGGVTHSTAMETSHIGWSASGQSHYSDGHTVVYRGEHIPMRGTVQSNSVGWPIVPHTSGHRGHSYANSQHDHHPYDAPVRSGGSRK